MVGAVREHCELDRIVVTAAKPYGGETPDRPSIGIWLGGRVAKG
ncbi:MAG: hypothetical protein WC580_00370 [Agrococcus sp.]